MPTESPYNLSDIGLRIKGCEEKDIPDFKCSDGEMAVAFLESKTIEHPTPFTIKVHVNWYLYLKLIGMYDWVMDNCPNKRVVHLAKYGRTRRVRNKNFRRAMRILGKEIDG